MLSIEEGKAKRGEGKKTKGRKSKMADGKMLTGMDLAQQVMQNILEEYPQYSKEHAMELAMMLSKIELDDM